GRGVLHPPRRAGHQPLARDAGHARARGAARPAAIAESPPPAGGLQYFLNAARVTVRTAVSTGEEPRMSNDKKPDFSNVKSGVTSTEQAAPPKPDFSNVQSSVTSTEEIIGGQERSYTIEKGDTLSGIAQRFYGKA